MENYHLKIRNKDISSYSEAYWSTSPAQTKDEMVVAA
jgi:hypothetical protein